MFHTGVAVTAAEAPSDPVVKAIDHHSPNNASQVQVLGTAVIAHGNANSTNSPAIAAVAIPSASITPDTKSSIPSNTEDTQPNKAIIGAVIGVVSGKQNAPLPQAFTTTNFTKWALETTSLYELRKLLQN